MSGACFTRSDWVQLVELIGVEVISVRSRGTVVLSMIRLSKVVVSVVSGASVVSTASSLPEVTLMRRRLNRRMFRRSLFMVGSFLVYFPQV